MFRSPVVITFTCTVLLLGTQAFAQTKRPLSRQEFANAISQLKKEDSDQRVLELLGKPDDVRTKQDSGGIGTSRTKEIWRYGTAGHLEVATLGQVFIDTKDRVQYVFGAGSPPPSGMFDDEELRKLLVALGEVPSYDSMWRYNPRRVILAVNLLQPLGKEKALAAIEEYLRVASSWDDEGRDGVFLVLRTLFDIPADPGHMPPMMVGAPSVREPKDPKLLPRFPIALEGDIPFLLSEGFSIGGRPEQPESHVAYFRKHGIIRANPLMPSEEPFTALEAFANSPRWVFKENDSRIFGDERGRNFLGNQILRFMDTVYRVEPEPYSYGALLPLGKENAALRDKLIVEASNLKMKWDGKRNQYTFLDGTTVPELVKKIYRREIWRPAHDLELEIVFEREDRRMVSVWVAESFSVGKEAPVAVLKVFEVTAKDKTLLEFEAGGAGAGGRSMWRPLRMDEGHQVQVDYQAGGKSHLSPVLKP